VSADSAHVPDGSSSSAQLKIGTSSARHWVLPQHMRKRSQPFGHHQRAYIGDVVLALRRAPKGYQFLDAQVLDVANRRRRAAWTAEEGIAGLRSELQVQLAYPPSQLYNVLEENETPRMIARKFGLPLAGILAANTHLCDDEVQAHSKLRKGTEMVLPDFPQASDTEASSCKGTRGSTETGGEASFHWDLEYLVQYLHGGQTWLGILCRLKPKP